MRHFAWSLLVPLFAAAVADAQLAAPVRQCIDGYNNKLRLVSQQAGKSARSCLRDAAKGSEPNPDTCVLADPDGRIADKAGKVQALYDSGKCTGSEPIQRGAGTGNAAHRGAVTALVHDLFGNPVTGAVVGVDSTDARCIDTVLKRSVMSFAAIAKGQRQCKKSGLAGGAVMDAATLEATCGTFAQVDGNGKAQTRLDQLVGDVGSACATSTAGLATLFPGLAAGCHAGGPALGACVAARTRCRACLAIAEADGQQLDCDAFDDGTANGSCFAFDLGTHTCTFASGSQVLILNTALPLSSAPSGAVTVSCGTTDAAQVAPCTCNLTNFGPMVLPAIGDFCITPAAGCPAGSIDCNGGAPRDLDVASDHDIGTCVSHASCATACDAHCAGLGASYHRQTSGCEGYCQGGGNDEMLCTQHSDCPGGRCTGNAPVHGHVCNCICEGTVGAPSIAGDLTCSLGLQVHVELPADGDCLDTPVDSLPPRCVGLTTADATGVNVDTDHIPGLILPASSSATTSGAALACGAIEAGSLSGMILVGHTVFFDSTLGDNWTRLKLVCQ